MPPQDCDAFGCRHCGWVPTPVKAPEKPTIVVTRDDLKLWAKRLRQIDDPNRTLMSVQIEYNDCIIILGEVD